MSAVMTKHIEDLFSSLVSEEKISIISYGVALRLPALRKRFFLAESQVRSFEERYGLSLGKLDTEGLPDDAGYEMHEDYIMWHHWADVIKETERRIASLKGLAEQGLYEGEILYASQ